MSVLPRGNEVLASTREGIYRSARTVHRWERLEVPGNLPLGGTFVAEPEDAANIYYYYLYDPMIPKPLSPHCLDSGIFRSRDDGKTWTLVDRETHVRSVLVLRDGTVGTLQWVPDESDTRKRRVWPIIRCSHDNGATWSDITHNADSRVDKLIVDPDNDSLIALLDLSAGFLPGLLRADDERYIWKERSVPPPSRVPPTDALYFGRDYYRATELFLCRATLSNYFEKPFQNPIPIPDQVSIPAFDVAPEQPEYQFDHFGPKVIQVQLIFDPGSDQAIQMVDDERGEAFWSAKVIDPAGRRKTLQNVGL